MFIYKYLIIAIVVMILFLLFPKNILSYKQSFFLTFYITFIIIILDLLLTNKSPKSCKRNIENFASNTTSPVVNTSVTVPIDDGTVNATQVSDETVPDDDGTSVEQTAEQQPTSQSSDTTVNTTQQTTSGTPTTTFTPGTKDYLSQKEYSTKDKAYYTSKAELIDSSWDHPYFILDTKHWRPHVEPPPVCIGGDECEPCPVDKLSSLPLLLKNFDKTGVRQVN